MVSKPAVIGIDIGSDSAFVGYVSKGIVDIVQNEVSSRKTPSLVGFTQVERLLGDSALSQIKSNAKNSCRNFKHLLGRPLNAPDLEVEKFWSTCPLATDSDGFAGYDVTYKDEAKVFSAGEVTAMFLTKLKDVTEAWTQSPVADVVIGVPSDFADQQRQALLDAAEIAGLNVLRIMNEHTAVALAYGIYRSNDFDPEKPQNVVFCNMGHSIFSVSVVAFVKGRLTVLCEFNDKVGGRDMDECLMRRFAEEFKKKTGCDVISNKKACFKLEDAVGKCKKILSANSEAPCTAECLMEDEDFASNVTRDAFEEMCQPMMARVQKVLDKAREACGLSGDDINFVEIAGGCSRVPWLKKMCSDSWYGKDLSTTLNADECVARGCTLQAAILSPLYKVRDFKVEDTSPFSVSIGWEGTSAEGADKEEDGDAPMAEGETSEVKAAWATVYPAGSAMNLLKMLTFFRKGPFDIKAKYAETGNLLPGTPAELGTFKVELPPQTENKKVKVKAKLTQHGTFSIESAQMVEEEEYEETVKEKQEIPPDEAVDADKKEGEAKPDEPMPEASGDEKKEGDAKEGEDTKPEVKEEKPPEKKYKWVEVKKMKKRTKRTDLTISTTGCVGLDKTIVQKRKDNETAMISEMKEFVDTQNAKNDLEAYSLEMRSKIEAGGKYGDFINAADREKFTADLIAAEDWLYDHFDSEKKVVYVEKLQELKVMGNPVVWRYNENENRPDWMSAIEGTVNNYRAAAANPGEKYGHIAPEKLASIVKECDDITAWVNDLKAKQAQTPKDAKPVLLCADMEKKNTALANMADKILAEKKPEPPKEKKEEKPKEEPKSDEKPTEGAEPADEKPGPENMDVD